MSYAIPFDTLAFVRDLETAGVPSAQAEVQAKALAFVLQNVEEFHLKELATKGDILRLESKIELTKAELRKEIETAKVETIKWVIATGFLILGGVIAINRFYPPLPVYHTPPVHEMGLSAKPPVPSINPPSR